MKVVGAIQKVGKLSAQLLIAAWKNAKKALKKMSDYQVLSKKQHSNYRWKRATNYAFSAADAVVPLVQQEVHRAALHMPVAFAAHGDGFVVVAVLGIEQGQNLLVSPSGGQWVGGYVPAVLRGYPFALIPTVDGRKVLAMDVESGLVGEAVEGEFLLANDQPTEPVQALLNFLNQIDKDRAVTSRLCALLAAHGLIQPWPIKGVADEGDRHIGGLFRIDSSALNKLDAHALHALQQAGALQLAYMQLISMEHLPSLGKLVQMHAQYANDQNLLSDQLGKGVSFMSDTLKFD